MKKLIAILAAVLMLGLCGCESAGDDKSTGEYKGTRAYEELTIEDLEGFWYPAEGIGSTVSVLTSVYIDGDFGTWEEYDQYGNPTDVSGQAYTDGELLTLADVPLIGDVEIPIGDENTLLNEEGELYWIKGEPDYRDEPEEGDITGLWYFKGETDSSDILVLNEDGTFSRGEWETGTYSYEVHEYQGNGPDEAPYVRHEIELSTFASGSYYLIEDGKVLMYWSEDEYFVREDAMDDEELLAKYSLMDGDFETEDYILTFKDEYIVTLQEFMPTDSGSRVASEIRSGTWELSEGTVTITWYDGETEEAALEQVESQSPFRMGEIVDTLTLPSLGDVTLEHDKAW